MNNVKKYRLILGKSQKELSEQVNVSRQTINLLENNKYNPTLKLCISIAHALNTDLNKLFWEEFSNE